MAQNETAAQDKPQCIMITDPVVAIETRCSQTQDKGSDWVGMVEQCTGKSIGTDEDSEAT